MHEKVAAYGPNKAFNDLNLYVVDILTIFFGGHLSETENNEYVKFLVKKMVAVTQEIGAVVTYDKIFETVFD